MKDRDETEQLLLAKIARADTVALEILYHRLRPRLHRFLLALGLAADTLDEICNETFFVVWNRAASFDGSCRASTWIFAIARNKLMDAQRRERRHAARFEETQMERLPETRLDVAARFELDQDIGKALEHLPAEQRAVIELAFIDGLSYQEIADVMACPESTVKTRMFHARRKLRHCFPEFGQASNRRNSP